MVVAVNTALVFVGVLSLSLLLLLLLLLLSLTCRYCCYFPNHYFSVAGVDVDVDVDAGIVVLVSAVGTVSIATVVAYSCCCQNCFQFCWF